MNDVSAHKGSKDGRLKEYALISWIGETDLRSSEGRLSEGVGPIASARDERAFDHVVLLSNYPKERAQTFLSWYEQRYDHKPSLHDVVLDSPMDFKGIHQNVVRVVDGFRQAHPDAQLVFHLSPGTSAMAAVWLILSKTRYEAEVIQTHYDRDTKLSEVKTVEFPFELSAEFIGDILRRTDQHLIRSSQGLPPAAPELGKIIHQCEAMRRVLGRARRVAQRSVPVLIQGESGTGKELLARAIHAESPRAGKPFVPINCGAIPRELVESEFFGHKKGAFTGATQSHDGAFRAANGGTLFLDEIGELPLEQQVKLLRALQEEKVRPVGESREYKVDVRIICATNRGLYEDVYEGSFREDLFHRIAVAILDLPPLREREGDLHMLMDALLEELNKAHLAETKGEARSLSPAARRVLQAHSWPGNIRELKNTLLRALIWSDGSQIAQKDARDAILRRPPNAHDDILEHELGDSFDLRALEKQVRRHYVLRALEKTGGNKTRAGQLLGGISQQTLSNWMDTLGVLDEA